MILTPVSPDDLPGLIKAFERSLESDGRALQVFRDICNTQRFAPNLVADLHQGRYKAIALANQLGIGTIDEEPARAFSWDGASIRTRSETSVVFHEIAHWMISPPERRCLYDFGLGAGPETGNAAAANAVVCVDQATREDEENLASLLGILLEVAHGEPAIIAFAEQNWLELADRPHTARHFGDCLGRLVARGLYQVK